ncbi:MAG: hypothetical protein HY518_04265 [Candidatus Aenigmarchaeota archaeon]|nr:hypothetical protein [Candidatus Aenigmarchaeota archaeon]
MTPKSFRRLIISVLVAIGIIISNIFHNLGSWLFSADFAVLAVFFIPIGAVLLFAGMYFLKKRNLVADTPTSRIRSLAMGLVEIYGKVEPINVLTAELTGKSCVYYQYSVEELRTEGKSQKWVKIMGGGAVEPFYLADGTGSVMVAPKGAEVEIPNDLDYQSGWGKDPPESVKAFLKSHNRSFEGLLGINKTMRFREELIAPGDMLYIMGTAAKNPLAKKAATGLAGIAIMKGTNDRTFYISDRPESAILRSLTLATAACIAIGSLLTILGLFIVFFGNA